MKVLLVSNAPWVKTGYGTQAASLARRLRDSGHQVTFYCTFGLEGGVQQWEGITCLPSNGQGFVDPIIRGHLRYTQPDLVITLFDLWPWRGTEIVSWIREVGAKWLAWFPIDAVPLSWANIEVLDFVDYPVPLANFVEEELKNIDKDFRVHVIPHGIEKDFGYTANGRREFRRQLQIPDDAFLFGSVGRNAYYPGRKGFDRLIRAFGKANLPNSYLYLHTGDWSESGSVPVSEMIKFYERESPGITERIKLADEYNLVMGYSQDGMNALYSSLDCYVQPTLGEGFGIPVMEAQACGCAVIATDCTSMPELVAPNSSELVPGATELFVPDPSHRVLIDIDKLAESMARVYEIKRDDPAGFRAMKGTAGQWANNWDWDKLWAEEWTPLLASVAGEIERSPRTDWHRGGAQVFEHNGFMRKQESVLRSPVVAKELDMLDRLGSHLNLIPVAARGKTEDGLNWYDMPKLTPLRDLVVEDLSEVDVACILDGVRSALSFMHQAGVAHRDVAPENVVVDANLNAYLIDFEWAHSCDGEIGTNCVDFEPWAAMKNAVPTVQTGMHQRGFHTIVNYLRGLPLETKTHGFKSVPYQQVDGVGERDCETRWKLMKPDVKGKRVLDIGCNLGWFVRKSLEEGAATAVGIENDEAVVESAKALGPGEFHVFDLDSESLGGHYDVAFALSVLQHLKDPDRVLKELLVVADEVYIEQPIRQITDYMANVIAESDYCGESERGRPIYRVKVKVPA